MDTCQAVETICPSSVLLILWLLFALFFTYIECECVSKNEKQRWFHAAILQMRKALRCEAVPFPPPNHTANCPALPRWLQGSDVRGPACRRTPQAPHGPHATTQVRTFLGPIPESPVMLEIREHNCKDMTVMKVYSNYILGRELLLCWH